MAIIDQRGEFGVTSIAQLLEVWRERFDGRPQVMHQVAGEQPAYVNHSRWVARCPECPGAASTWPDHRSTLCFGCGALFRVRHPSKQRIGEALPLLLERPDPATRNWEHVTSVRGVKLDEHGQPMHDLDRWNKDGWESVGRLRSENRLIGGLRGDGIGDERDLIVTPARLTSRSGISTADVTVPDGGLLGGRR